MPKEIKGNPRRKPPAVAPGHSDIEVWLDDLVPRLQPIVRRLDEAIRAAVRDLNFAVKYNRAFYGLSELGWMIEIAPYFVSVNVLFLGGADFDRPPPLGTTGRTRYIKITAVEETTQPELREWFAQAARTPGWS